MHGDDMTDETVPDLVALEWESLPNEFRDLPRLPPRGRPVPPRHGRRPPGTGPALLGPDWFDAWVLTPVKPPR